MEIFPQADPAINQTDFALRCTLPFIASAIFSHPLAETEWILLRRVTFGGEKSKGC
jgi:hypothetical protein